MLFILGLVTGLKGEFVTQVALGKAHAIALTSKGQVFTFGINNKFQCGREFIKQSSKDGKLNGLSLQLKYRNILKHF